MADDARDGPDSTTAASGKVVGYEMSVVCPKCGYNTDPIKHEASQSETVICGEDAPGSDEHGCGHEQCKRDNDRLLIEAKPEDGWEIPAESDTDQTEDTENNGE
jgi:hypothetical protein